MLPPYMVDCCCCEHCDWFYSVADGSCNFRQFGCATLSACCPDASIIIISFFYPFHCHFSIFILVYLPYIPYLMSASVHFFSPTNTMLISTQFNRCFPIIASFELHWIYKSIYNKAVDVCVCTMYCTYSCSYSCSVKWIELSMRG